MWFKSCFISYEITISDLANYSIEFGLTVNTYTEKAYIDLQYTGNNEPISDNATLHEMAHAWDSYYEFLGHKRICSQTNMVNFYNSIPAESKLNLPLKEWFAGLFTEWYWHYKGYDTSKPTFAGYKAINCATKGKCFNWNIVLNKSLSKIAGVYKDGVEIFDKVVASNSGIKKIIAKGAKGLTNAFKTAFEKLANTSGRQKLLGLLGLAAVGTLIAIERKHAFKEGQYDQKYNDIARRQ